MYTYVIQGEKLSVIARLRAQYDKHFPSFSRFVNLL